MATETSFQAPTPTALRARAATERLAGCEAPKRHEPLEERSEPGERAASEDRVESGR